MNDTVNSFQTNRLRTGHDYSKVKIPIIFLLIILFFSAWVRFYGITEQGISLGDSFGYMREAKIWADGQPPKFRGSFYRPVSYFLQGMAVKIFGYNDYSVKILHGLMDMINILLIFFIASKLAEYLWVGVISSLLYAFLPGVIKLTRSGNVQVESTTFVLLAFFFFILFETQKKKGLKIYLWLFLSGLSLGLAANTHPDLAFLAPGYILYLFIKLYNRQNKKKFLKEFLGFASIFSFSFFTPYFLGFIIFGAQKIIRLMLKAGSTVKWQIDEIYGSEPIFRLFFSFIEGSIRYYFKNNFFFISVMLIGTFFIMIYRKIKKESDSSLAYLPLILIFSYVLIYICFIRSAINSGRYTMPLLPLVIVMVTIWYYKIAKQFLGRYSLVAFVCVFLILFLLNPKEIPGKGKRISPYRIIYDTLRDDVNPGNKLLIAPVSIYSLDRGYQFDLYFGKNAIYLCRLPLESEYNPGSLKKLLQSMNIRYIFLGKTIDRRLLNSNSPVWRRCSRWFNNKKKPYSLEKDLRIINDCIRSEGGLIIDTNRFGKIYYLTGEKLMQKKFALIENGSFEHWWKALPMGNWKLAHGSISRSSEATEGFSSIRFEPADKKGSRIIRTFENLYKNEVRLRVHMDVKAGISCKFCFFFTAKIDGKKQIIKPGIVKYTGKGDWITMVNDFTITPDMKGIIFHLRLLPGAREPAYVDNLSIELLED